MKSDAVESVSFVRFAEYLIPLCPFGAVIWKAPPSHKQRPSRGPAVTMIEYRIVRPNELTSDEVACWCRMQQSNKQLDSPFFRPEYVQAVAKVRDDVNVTVVSDASGPRAFFPFQVDSHGHAQSVGGKICEFQGVICNNDTEFSVVDIIRKSGIAVWRFDHLLANQQFFKRFFTRESHSPFMDLTKGFDEFLQRGIAKTGTYQSTRRKQRKLIREVGPLRFEFHTLQSNVIDHLIEWKTAQYLRTETLNFFAYPWIVDLLRTLQHTNTEHFAGVVSALFCNDKLIAVHHGIRSRDVLHIWFPAYNREFEKYSPGLILLLELAKGAAVRGIARIDFGKGDERYKASLKSGETPVCVGSVDTRPIMGSIRGGWQKIKRTIRSSKMRTTFESLMKISNQSRERNALR